jgi:hypothetical protein
VILLFHRSPKKHHHPTGKWKSKTGAKMAYAILRHGKIKGSGKGVCVAHNRRLAGEQKENIDASLTPLNQYLGDAGVVGRINGKLPGKRRKDAVEAVELLLTASPEFFNGIETDRQKLAAHPTFQEWKKATVAWARAELGQNIVDIALHMDESNPHMHVLFVPMVEGRLCAKEVTSRSEMVRRQTSYADVMGKFGLQRGDSATETHRRHTPLKDKPSATGGKVIQEQAAVIEALRAELAQAQVAVEKAQARFLYQQQLNINNLKVLSDLEAENKAIQELSQGVKEAEARAEVEAHAKIQAEGALKTVQGKLQELSQGVKEAEARAEVEAHAKIQAEVALKAAQGKLQELSQGVKEAEARAEVEAHAKIQAGGALKAAQGKLQEQVELNQKLNSEVIKMENSNKNLIDENKQLIDEFKKYKETHPDAFPSKSVLKAVDAVLIDEQKAKNAMLEKYPGIKHVEEAEGYVIHEVSGNSTVVHLGRGKFGFIEYMKNPVVGQEIGKKSVEISV